MLAFPLDLSRGFNHLKRSASNENRSDDGSFAPLAGGRVWAGRTGPLVELEVRDLADGWRPRVGWAV